MARSTSAKKVSFPRIDRITLENFDLYSRDSNVDVKVEKPVFCLIGANGLGKSTFLNAINFAVTGALPDPNRKFHSAKDYYEYASRPNRVEDYFGGRISEEAREIARVSIVLSWPSRTIAVTRNLFGNVGITQLLATPKGAKREATLTSIGIGKQDLGKIYENEVVRLTGLEDFAQFVFLTHFVETFDEGRHLLMWDHSALTNALYLAFGADPAAAQAADKLQRDMDRESSRGRNVRFSARHVADRIKILQQILAKEPGSEHITTEELKTRHEMLLNAKKVADERVRRKQGELRDADLKWTDLSAALTEAQLEYRKLFSTRLKLGSSVEHHPIIRATLSEDRCAVCGTNHRGAIIKKKLSLGHCPLCDATIDVNDPDDNTVESLRKLDAHISKVREGLASILRTRDRVSAEFTSAQASEEAAATAMAAFENDHPEVSVINETNQGFSGIQKEIQKLEKERQEFLAQSEAHYKKRDTLRQKLRVYENQLKKQYEVGSQQFVPRFRELAEEFIGLPIDVSLEHRQGANDSGFGLSLSMDDQLRPEPETVSESQRFFIEIALRMALSEFMSATAATLILDTPEGSLDIAYEARAGLMFSTFVKEGNFILMTANLRSSELVLRLAQLRKRRGMQIVKMTDWTDLSEVQQSEEALFTSAYAAIEAALNR
jgi:ABC-type cobalamin transport system ATPase subunit